MGFNLARRSGGARAARSAGAADRPAVHDLFPADHLVLVEHRDGEARVVGEDPDPVTDGEARDVLRARRKSMSTGTLVAGPLPKIGRPELAQIPVPEATLTHRPVPHHVIVEALVETLSFRHIGVVNEEYAVSFDGMKMFGVLDLETQMEGCRFSIGIRNSHDKSIRLGLTSGLRVFVCSNMAFSGEFTPVTMLQ